MAKQLTAQLPSTANQYETLTALQGLTNDWSAANKGEAFAFSFDAVGNVTTLTLTGEQKSETKKPAKAKR